MNPALALSIIQALLSDLPHLVIHVKQLVADIEGKQTDPQSPLAPQVTADTQTVSGELNTPLGGSTPST